MRPLWRIMRYLKPYWTWLLAGVISLAGTVVTFLAIPRLTQMVIDQGIAARHLPTILWGSLAMVGAALLQAVFSIVNAVASARASQGVAFDLRNLLFGHILTLSFGNLDRLQTGQLMTRISSDVDQVRMFASMGLMMLLRAVMMISGSLVLIFRTDQQLAWIMLVLMPTALALFWIFASKARPMFKKVQQKLAALNTVLQENLAGVRVVRAFVRADYEIARFEERNDDLMRQSIAVGKLLALALPTMFLIINLGTLAVVWIGGRQAIAGQLTVGQLVAFNSYLMSTMFPLMMLGMTIGMMSGAVASAERIFEILDMKPEVQERRDALQLSPISGQVAFEEVSFQYNSRLPEVIADHQREEHAVPEKGEDVLCDVDFEVEPGQTIALLGATGSGKSTLIHLIPRFYDASSGEVNVDGTDVREVTLRSLRRQMGIVLQETVLFSGTIRDNIAYGRPDATEEEIIAAAKAAQAHDFIMSFPQGYDSPVGERGVNLSGGQKQRIAIARALLMNPRILILDDSTSSVDVETEARIRQALDELDCTKFIIAQRISTVLGADQIFVIDRGRIVARGTHQELMRTSPIYREIYHSQLDL